MSSSIEEIKKTGEFTWGKLVAWHEIGPYTLLEYHPHKFKDNRAIHNEYTDEVSFHGWIDGKDIHESWPTLETGIIGLICKKHSGGSALEYFFCRGIQAPLYDGKEIKE